MTEILHFQRLINMYHAAKINQLVFPETKIEIRSGHSEIEMMVNESYHHAMNAMHGCVYFKLLDDAAYFAAATKEESFFLLTASFTVELKRPFSSGLVLAKGEFVGLDGNRILSEAKLFDENGKVLAIGSGLFARSKEEWKDF